MKERLPIWLQAAAMLLLSLVFMAILGWVWWQDEINRDGRGRVINAAHDILYPTLPLAIIFLGVRFFGRLVRERIANWSSIIGWFAMVFLVPVVLVLLVAQKVQVNRGACLPCPLSPLVVWNSFVELPCPSNLTSSASLPVAPLGQDGDARKSH